MTSVGMIAIGAALVVALGACGEPATKRSPRRTVQAGPQLLLAGDGKLWTVEVASRRVTETALEQLTPGDPPRRILRRAAAPTATAGDHRA